MSMQPSDMAGEPALCGDNAVLPFAVRPLGVRGRVVRLGTVIDEIVRRHDYPPAVSALLAETVALAALLGTSLKFDGKLIIQTSTDGPVSLVVADYTADGSVRGYARFDEQALDALLASGKTGQASLLGKGHMALTIDQGPHTERYQGIVALDGGGLSDAAHDYFARSEQIPTFLCLASGTLVAAGADGKDTWRAGAIMVQHLPDEGGVSPMALSQGDAPPGAAEIVPEDDNWIKARILAETAEDHELIDPTLQPERLLYRLFHEDGVTVFPSLTVDHQCSCRRETVQQVLKSFGQAERAEMIEDGRIVVNCEFCSARYAFDPDQFRP